MSGVFIYGGLYENMWVYIWVLFFDLLVRLK